MRVVSLTCSNTEIVCALGAAHVLVGVDDHSDFPVDVVGRLARVGPDLSVDARAVAALRPDLVLASLTVPGHERVVAALLAEGLPVEVLEPKSVLDVYRDVTRIGALLGRASQAAALVASMQSVLDARPEAAAPPRVLVEWWPRPVIVPGQRSWVTQQLLAAGGLNPMGERPVESSPITDAEAVALAPEAVVISWCGVPAAKYRPDVVLRREAWRELAAVRDGHVYCVPEAFLGRPGPRLVEGVHALREVVARVRAGRGASPAR
ncbi:MAG: helical backbone metal receptor [Polyangiales bacterium]|nr:ABC transporter substrate-binding protein [Myxococcales bacterium]MCB9661295.1 ABC transporter substrate-binding protein [Sandaracinaceae bacterium]